MTKRETPTIRSSRLILLPFTAGALEAAAESPEALGTWLGAEVTAEWPPETLADALPWFREQLGEDPEGTGWYGWFVLLAGESGSPPVLAASVGSVGRPDENGILEIGYAVLPPFRGRGIAGEAVAHFLAWALAEPSVTRVIARTAPSNTPSVALLARLGFVPAGPVDEAGDQRHELARELFRGVPLKP